MEIGRECGFLGIAYRSGVGDLRESSALELALKMIEEGFLLKIYDPFVKSSELGEINSECIGTSSDFSQAVLAVRHSLFTLEFLGEYKRIIDINSCLSVAERKLLRESGSEVFQLGDFSC